MAKKKKKIIEVNVMNISLMFQVHPPYGFGEVFQYFCKINVLVAMAKINSLDKIHM